MRQWPQFWQQLKIDGLDYSCKEYYLQLSFFAFFFSYKTEKSLMREGNVRERNSQESSTSSVLPNVRGFSYGRKLNDTGKTRDRRKELPNRSFQDAD